MNDNDVSERTDLQGRIEQNPADIEARRALATQFIEAGDNARAAVELASIVEVHIANGHGAKAAAVGRETLSLDPKNIEHRLLMARVYAAFPDAGIRAARPVEDSLSDTGVMELQFTASLEMQVLRDVSLPPREDSASQTRGLDTSSAMVSIPSQAAPTGSFDVAEEPHTGPFPVKMPESVADGLLNAMKQVTYADGATIVPAGDVVDRLIQVVSGEPPDSGSGEVLGEGALVGAFEFLTATAPAGSIVARGEVTTREIGRFEADVLKDVVPELGRALDDLLSERILSALVSRSPIFEAVAPPTRRGFAARFATKSVAAGEAVVRTGEVCRTMIVVRTGGLAVDGRRTSEGEAITLGPGAFLGYVSAVLERPSQATLVATGPTTLLVLSEEDVSRLVAGHKSVSRVARKEALERGEAVLSSESVAGIGGLVTRRV